MCNDKNLHKQCKKYNDVKKCYFFSIKILNTLKINLMYKYLICYKLLIIKLCIIYKKLSLLYKKVDLAEKNVSFIGKK